MSKLEKESASHSEYESKIRGFKDEICGLQDKLNEEIRQRNVREEN